MFGKAALGPHFDWLGAALAAAEASGIDSKLQSLYNQMPATDCARQGQCCSLLPPTTGAEMLSLLLRPAVALGQRPLGPGHRTGHPFPLQRRPPPGLPLGPGNLLFRLYS